MELSSNGEVSQRGHELLKEWRGLIKKWSLKIEGEISKGTGNFQEDIEELEKTLLVIKICSAFSYNFSPSKHWKEVMLTQLDLVEWFHTVHHLNQKDTVGSKLSKFMQILLNEARSVAFKVNIELEAIHDPFIASALQRFTAEKWEKSSEFSGDPIIQYKTQKHLIELKFISEDQLSADYVTYDFLLGTFLVNGFPAKCLPAEITSNKQFIRFFQPTNAKIMVQPESEGVFRTKNKFHGSHYEFRRNSRENKNLLVITEVKENERLILLDPVQLNDYLQPFFVKNFTHWLSLEHNEVYFKRLCKQDSDFDLNPEYKLIKIDNGSWIFSDEGAQGYIMSIKSTGFLNISGVLSGLELSKHVNVLIEKIGEIIAYLPRQTLRFKVNENDLESVEYPGFFIDGVQLKTLTGLQQGIQLKKGEQIILLLPHGNINLEQAPYHHRTVIELQKLHSPPYFVYEVDQVLKRLKGNMNRLSYLYLAYLHALTSLSSCLPDPFTEVTGTEMALRILQSGFIWSSAPYDENCKKYLHLVQNLSPKRSSYGHKFSNRRWYDSAEEIMAGIEMIEWPEILPTMSAYDGFHLIVHKLIDDSERFAVLYQQNPTQNQQPRFLRCRAYLKYLSFYNNLAQLDIVLEYGKVSQSEIILKSKRNDSYQVESLRVAAYLRNAEKLTKSPQFNPNSFIAFLLESHKPVNEFLPGWHSSFKEMLCFDLRGSWFQLYEMALKPDKTQDEKQYFTLLLSTLAYRGAPLEQLLIFHYLANLSSNFPAVPNLLPSPQRNVPWEDHSKVQLESNIGNILERNKIPLPGKVFLTMEEREAWEKEKLNIENVMITAKEYLTLVFQTDVDPTSCLYRKFVREDLKHLLEKHFQMDSILVELNTTVETFNTDKMLRMFCKKLQVQLQKKYELLPENENQNTILKGIGEVNGVVAITPRIKTNPKSLNLEYLDSNIFAEAKHIFKTGKVDLNPELKPDSSWEQFKVERRRLEEIVLKFRTNFLKMLNGNNQEGCGLSTRTDPTSLLRTLLRQKSDIQLDRTIQTYTGALAVLWTKIKTLDRCISLKSGKNEKSEIEKELENKGHENWSPQQFPEWVCLELELDLMIRPKQVEVARQMIEMPNEKNGVMQLNMGEGKTSVITPMLCCALGGKDKLCRVTVLSSMLNMNEKILGFAIGGLINKRLYLVPCRRGLDISVYTAQVIQNSYEECMKLQGVVLALPEHRLSFRLLAYDNILKNSQSYEIQVRPERIIAKRKRISEAGSRYWTSPVVETETSLGLKLWETENWLRNHARDILDESDELLNAKYQLVYTVGEKIDLDGGDIRWICAENLLKIIQEIGESLHKTYGDSVVEWDGKSNQDKPHHFPVFRLLDSSANLELTSKVADAIIEGFNLDAREKTEVKRFLVEENGDFGKIAGIFNANDGSKGVNKILTYAGYLRKGIFCLGLSKRWRVEYGVDNDKTSRLMAVPFRAKDFPAERTEFGHPDLAILLTHLSYYYSGLSDFQLGKTWENLKTKRDSESIYAAWLGKCRSVPGHLKNFQGINLKDSSQRLDLFNLLRKHTSVIDFFLGNNVFPKECKQFPSKLVMTAWDLCYEKNKHSTTGFSGTNDSSILLPLQITQQDLPSLKDTNARMEKTLLKPENKGHCYLKIGVTCKEVLERMRKDNLRVLIDAGALMLDLDNEQVARLWLNLDEKLEGVLYFNKKNELTVKCRGSDKDKDVPLELTPYQGSLQKIGVFLDDQHTRGADLKFPTNWRAVVTIGAGMKRDKLTQACMRMRKLDSGQSITFYLSYEVFDKIKNRQAQANSFVISTLDILEWVQQNTEKFNEDGLLYWAISGKNYAQRLTAEEMFLKGIGGRDHAAVILARQCVDEEVTKLISLYGRKLKVDRLVHVIKVWFYNSWDKITRLSFEGYMDPKAVENFVAIRDAVILRCREKIPDKLHFSSGENLEEEQEKELETELETQVEEERNVERPRRAVPATPKLHDNVVKIVETGERVKVIAGIQKLPEILERTTFWSNVQPNAWSQNVLATTDFISVLEKDEKGKMESFYFRTSTNTNLFLRPFEYFIVVGGQDTKDPATILILSSFEVNELLPLLREGNAKVSLHLFSPRKSEGQALLCDNPGLILKPTEMISSPFLEMSSLSSIQLAAGNLYFSSMEEQQLFARFLCIAPKPWSRGEELAFERGMITKTGFMVLGYSGRRDSKTSKDLGEGFRENPEGLVRNILSCRHSVLSEISHVVRILNEKRFVNLK